MPTPCRGVAKIFGSLRSLSTTPLTKTLKPPLVRRFLILWNAPLFPQGFLFYFLFNLQWFFYGWLKKIQGEISSFIMGIFLAKLKKKINFRILFIFSVYLLWYVLKMIYLQPKSLYFQLFDYFAESRDKLCINIKFFWKYLIHGYFSPRS